MLNPISFTFSLYYLLKDCEERLTDDAERRGGFNAMENLDGTEGTDFAKNISTAEDTESISEGGKSNGLEVLIATPMPRRRQIDERSPRDFQERLSERQLIPIISSMIARYGQPIFRAEALALLLRGATATVLNAPRPLGSPSILSCASRPLTRPNDRRADHLLYPIDCRKRARTEFRTI